MSHEIGCIHNRSKTEVWMCGACAFQHIEELRQAELRVAALTADRAGYEDAIRRLAARAAPAPEDRRDD